MAIAFPLASAPGLAAGCPETAGPSEPARLSGVDPAGDLQLADGRTIRLVGLAPRQDDAEEARFRAAVQPLVGREVVLTVTGGKDRWGRWPARIGLPGEDETAGRDMALLLRRAGAARPLPEASQAPCSIGPEVAPASAVGGAASRAGVASSDAVDGHDLAAVKAQEGRYLIIEGRIASVGERAQRTYLNFSRKPGEAAAVVVSRKLWRELQAAGWTAAGLGGKRLRAHGVLGGRDGLLLEATSRGALELID
ncbi:hypothetical protein [Bosea sp. (in: a-proteobacteria)]|uniref:hypothetical protein n=1 Tax=Bosea sp. (in: a-proteobacteria) TaxID=1871050 RepID=UPI001200A1A6|nr:hypothetical protein [Bosea sp. (in: a-proteobacteria)]TAJ28791.1 MAG: hypothetical protein EPO59_17710 [Bosea sp. (in: a-proteobacteria)]